MTTEEKAKAYDEAIKKAKEIKEKIVYSHLSTESCKAVSEYIDTIIPELRESEDERIRRRMVEHFKSKTKETWCSIPVKDILAWLEKQKEQMMKELSEKIAAAYQLGLADKKEQMLKEAVEGTIDDCGIPARLRLEMPVGSFRIGDKVRVIVLPKEDRL